MYPDISGHTIIAVLAGGMLLAVVGGIATLASRYVRRETTDAATASAAAHEQASRESWRMPPLHELPPPRLTLASRVWMAVLRGYLVIAVGLVVVKIVQMMVLK
jgi:hypothetical protein